MTIISKCGLGVCLYVDGIDVILLKIILIKNDINDTEMEKRNKNIFLQCFVDKMFILLLCKKIWPHLYHFLQLSRRPEYEVCLHRSSVREWPWEMLFSSVLFWNCARLDRDFFCILVARLCKHLLCNTFQQRSYCVYKSRCKTLPDFISFAWLESL